MARSSTSFASPVSSPFSARSRNFLAVARIGGAGRGRRPLLGLLVGGAGLVEAVGGREVGAAAGERGAEEENACPRPHCLTPVCAGGVSAPSVPFRSVSSRVCACSASVRATCSRASAFASSPGPGRCPACAPRRRGRPCWSPGRTRGCRAPPGGEASPAGRARRRFPALPGPRPPPARGVPPGAAARWHRRSRARAALLLSNGASNFLPRRSHQVCSRRVRRATARHEPCAARAWPSGAQSSRGPLRASTGRS